MLDGSFRPAELADRTDRITARLEEEGLDLVVHLPTQVAEFVADHEDRIGHVHVNDNREATDEHLPVGAGDIDFETVLGAFSPDWEGTFTLEVSTSSYPYLRQSKAELDAML